MVQSGMFANNDDDDDDDDDDDVDDNDMACSIANNIFNKKI